MRILNRDFFWPLVAIGLVFAIVVGATWPAKAADKGGSRVAGPLGIEDNAPWTPNWSGIYLGVHGGSQLSSSALSAESGGVSVLSVDGLGGNGWLYGVHGGVGWRFKGTPLYAGLDGAWQFGESDFAVNVTTMGSVISVSIAPTYKIGPRIGYILPNGSMVYAGVQYAAGELNVGGAITANPNVCKLAIRCNVDLQGVNGMVGIEIPVANNLTFAIQGDWTRYKEENLLQTPSAGQGLNVEADVLSVVGRLNIKLPGL